MACLLLGLMNKAVPQPQTDLSFLRGQVRAFQLTQKELRTSFLTRERVLLLGFLYASVSIVDGDLTLLPVLL